MYISEMLIIRHSTSMIFNRQPKDLDMFDPPSCKHFASCLVCDNEGYVEVSLNWLNHDGYLFPLVISQRLFGLTL